MPENIWLSLCIPTNGIVEWVVPVLDSIYKDNVSLELFEVVITDNGNNSSFKTRIAEYIKKYPNIVYKETDSKMFLNQIDAFKLARGHLIKFINHRMPLLPGALDYLISFAKEFYSTTPGVYFSNGKLKSDAKRNNCKSFDEYVRKLSYWSSWSAGTAIWKKDFDKIDLFQGFNALFPHTDLVFADKTKKEYVVDDTSLLYEIPSDNTKKGNYDLFNAFAVEYPKILESLYSNGYITHDTYNYVIKQNKAFVSELFLTYVIKNQPCSYRIDNYAESFGKYYSCSSIRFKANLLRIKIFLNRFGKH